MGFDCGQFVPACAWLARQGNQPRKKGLVPNSGWRNAEITGEAAAKGGAADPRLHFRASPVDRDRKGSHRNRASTRSGK
jgi:hypothetical protein